MTDGSAADDFAPKSYREYLRSLAFPRPDCNENQSAETLENAPAAARAEQHKPAPQPERTDLQLADWVRTILAQTLADAVRGESLGQSPASLTARPSSGHASRGTQISRLAAAIASLPDEQRRVVELKHLVGLTLSEICELTGATKAAVVGMLFQAMKRLRVLMNESTPQPRDGLSESR